MFHEFFDLAEYSEMVVWFKNLCVTTVQRARMKCTVFAQPSPGVCCNIKCNDSDVPGGSLDNE